MRTIVFLLALGALIGVPGSANAAHDCHGVATFGDSGYYECDSNPCDHGYWDDRVRTWFFEVCWDTWLA